MRRLVYFVAISVDGFIANEDGSHNGFAAEGEHFADLLDEFPEMIPAHARETFGIRGGNKRFDAVLMGRHTYDVGLKIGITSPYPHLRQYLFSRSLVESPDPDVDLIAEPPTEFVRRLKAEPGMDIWLCGGGALATALLEEIDEFILKVNPFLMGQGIPLFRGSIPLTQLRLTSCKTYDNGFMLLRYLRR